MSFAEIESLKARRSPKLGIADLRNFETRIAGKEPFTFVRFSDGEIEILRNRRLVISGSIVEFRNRIFPNKFPQMDEKTFYPGRHLSVRHSLLNAAMFRGSNFFKGIPTSHNRAVIDREFMLRLNGGYTEEITFADLLVNENYLYTREKFFPMVISNFEDIFIVGNWRSQLKGELGKAELIKIPDNFFIDFEETKNNVLTSLISVPRGSLILSSASSLSNIIGFELFKKRPDLTFLDVGTAINDWLGLPSMTREYHRLAEDTAPLAGLSRLGYRLRKEHKLQW